MHFHFLLTCRWLGGCYPFFQGLLCVCGSLLSVCGHFTLGGCSWVDNLTATIDPPLSRGSGNSGIGPPYLPTIGFVICYSFTILWLLRVCRSLCFNCPPCMQ